MLTDWLTPSAGDDNGARFAQQIRAHQRNGFRMLERLRVEPDRRRDEGETFATAWPIAVAKAMPAISNKGEHRTQWRVALNATRSAWRDAYEHEQSDEVVERVAGLEELVA
jgi:hypothetical protein